MKKWLMGGLTGLFLAGAAGDASAQNTRTRWQDQPHIAQLLTQIVRTLPSGTSRLCSVAHGPIPPDTRKKLFENVVFEVRIADTNRTFEVRSRNIPLMDASFCTSAPEHCSQGGEWWIYYCASGEGLFMGTAGRNYAPHIITNVRQEAAQFDTAQIIRLPADSEGRRAIPTQVPGCSLSSAWDESITSITWSGICESGVPTGEGEIEWLRGEEVYWRTLVGERWGIYLEGGALHVNVDLGQFNFSMTTCDQGISGYRYVQVVAPSDTPIEYFENGYVRRQVEWAIASYAHDQCPVPRKGYSNIAFRINIGDQEVVRGRSDRENEVNWGEYSNVARDNLIRQLQTRESERQRIAQERERQRQRLAEEQRAAKAAARFQEALDARLQPIRRQGETFITERRGNLTGLGAALVMNELATLGAMERGVGLAFPGVTSGVRVLGEGRNRRYAITFSISDPFVYAERQLLSEAQFRDWGSFNRQLQLAVGGSIDVACYFTSFESITQTERQVRATLRSFRSAGGRRMVDLDCR